MMQTGPSSICQWWPSCGQGHSLTCTHDPLHPRVLDAAFHVPQALDVPIGKHRDGHCLPVGEQDGQTLRRMLFPPQPWGEGQAPKLHLPTVLFTPRPSTPPAAQRAEGLALGLGCLPALGSPRVHSPHSLDVLPGRGARQGPLLLLGAPVDSQQLGHSSTWLSPTLNCGPQTNSRGPSAFGF